MGFSVRGLRIGVWGLGPGVYGLGCRVTGRRGGGGEGAESEHGCHRLVWDYVWSLRFGLNPQTFFLLLSRLELSDTKVYEP